MAPRNTVSISAAAKELLRELLEKQTQGPQALSEEELLTWLVDWIRGVQDKGFRGSVPKLLSRVRRGLRNNKGLPSESRQALLQLLRKAKTSWSKGTPLNLETAASSAASGAAAAGASEAAAATTAAETANGGKVVQQLKNLLAGQGKMARLGQAGAAIGIPVGMTLMSQLNQWLRESMQNKAAKEQAQLVTPEMLAAPQLSRMAQQREQMMQAMLLNAMGAGGGLEMLRNLAGGTGVPGEEVIGSY